MILASCFALGFGGVCEIGFGFFLLVMEEPGQLKRALTDATAGAIAGGISRTVTSPLDVIKIRFQVLGPRLLHVHSIDGFVKF